MSNLQKLGRGAIAVSPGTTIYTVPTGYKAIVKNIDVCNTTTGSLTASIYLVPTGSSASTANMLFPATTVLANTMTQWTGEQVLNAGDFIQGIGSAAGITVNVSGEVERLTA